MKRFLKLGLCLFLCAVELFCMFIPALAAETGQVEKTLSYSETSIYQDLLGKEPETISASDAMDKELQKTYPSSGFTAELISYTCEVDGNKVRHYFIFRSKDRSVMPEGLAEEQIEAMDKKCMLWFDSHGEYPPCKYSSIPYFFKLEVETDNSCVNGENIMISFYRFSFKYPASWQDITATQKTFAGGVSSGRIDIIYNLTDKKVVSAKSNENISLDVKMACKRVSTKEVNKFKQINTAMFLIPNEYFERYQELIGVSYTYDLYKGVPMLCTTDKTLYNSARNGTVYLHGIMSGNIVRNWRTLTNRFAFYTDTLNDDLYDFDTSDVMKIFKSISSPNKDNTQAADYIPNVFTTVKADDNIKTESYASAAGFWRKFWDGFWFKELVDDSVDIDSIETIEPTAELAAANDKTISSNYVIDEYYASDFRSLCAMALKSNSKVVLLRYLVSDYSATAEIPFNYSLTDGGDIIRSTSKGYLCYNDIIANFKIYTLYFGAHGLELSDPRVTKIGVDMNEVDFAGGGQSGNNLQGGISKSWFSWFLDFDFSSWLSILFKVVAGIVIFIVVVQVIKLIGYIRTAFGKRHHKDE